MNRDESEANAAQINAVAATGGSEHWQGETRAFLLLCESAIRKAQGETIEQEERS